MVMSIDSVYRYKFKGLNMSFHTPPGDSAMTGTFDIVAYTITIISLIWTSMPTILAFLGVVWFAFRIYEKFTGKIIGKKPIP